MSDDSIKQKLGDTPKGSYVVMLDYGDDQLEFFGPFDTNQAAVNYGQGILASDEDCIGFTSERVQKP